MSEQVKSNECSALVLTDCARTLWDTVLSMMARALDAAWPWQVAAVGGRQRLSCTLDTNCALKTYQTQREQPTYLDLACWST